MCGLYPHVGRRVRKEFEMTEFKWLWSKKLECVVEVLRAGNFPDTVMVRLPDDRVIQVYKSELENPNGR